MTTKIDFKKFHKGDNILITVSNDGKEETFSGEITNISYEQKILFFEDEGSDYECKFSEIKKITFNVDLTSFKKGDDVVITIVNNRKEESIFGKITDISEKRVCIDDENTSYECSFSEIKSISKQNKSISKLKGNILSVKIVAIFLVCLAILFVIKTVYQEKIIQEEKEKKIAAEIQLANEIASAPEKFNSYCGKILKTAPMSIYTRRAFCNCITREFVDTLGDKNFYYIFKNLQADFSFKKFIESAPKDKIDILYRDYQICEYSVLGAL